MKITKDNRYQRELINNKYSMRKTWEMITQATNTSTLKPNGKLINNKCDFITVIKVQRNVMIILSILVKK